MKQSKFSEEQITRVLNLGIEADDALELAGQTWADRSSSIAKQPEFASARMTSR